MRNTKLCHYLVLLIALFILTACGGSEENSRDLDDFAPSEADLYLDEFLDIIRSNAVTRNQVDWGALDTEVRTLAANATSINQLYPAITRALELINTNHSFLLSPSGELITYPSSVTCQQDIILDRPDDPRIGYLRIDAFSSRDSAETRAKAQAIQDEIAAQDSPEITAWIVDFRNNQGGNMWPMLTGLAPFFDQQILGYFVDPNEQATPWGINENGSFVGDDTVIALNNPYSLINPLPRIAVLVSQRTASSGEAVTIAFKSQFNVAFFGTDSCGLSTANRSFELRDGSTLFLTVSTIADRDLAKYGGRVPVDFPTTSDATVATAAAWLLE